MSLLARLLPGSAAAAITGNEKPINLLVIENKKRNSGWVEIFGERRVHGRFPVKVFQAPWSDISLAAYDDGKCIVTIPDKETYQTFSVDFVLVREQVKGSLPGYDWRSILYGLEYANIPSVNSLSSIYNFVERPWVFAQLRRIKKRLGADQFPLIEQNYHSSYKELSFTPPYPLAVKVGHGHAGFGKARVMSYHDLDDVASLVAASGLYCTSEHLYEGEYDLRIQKIGQHYRTFKRMSTTGNWKTNTGHAILEEIPTSEQYRRWADACCDIFGGLEILAVDAIHTTEGEELILEVNDTAIGISHDAMREDFGFIADLVTEKMEEVFSARFLDERGRNNE